MGIQGLLKGLDALLVPPPTCTQHNNNQNASEKRIPHNITQFKNQRLAIDISGWIFKAAYSVAQRLVEAIETNVHKVDYHCERIICNYVIRRCEELLSNAKIRKIYVVFDGKRCPLKEGTNKEREERRRRNLREAKRYKAKGQHVQAEEKYKACIKVVDWMTSSVSKAIQKKWGNSGSGIFGSSSIVECVFSPFEADAQLAKLCIDGLADAVVTEDSDLLVYSTVCLNPFPIIFKLDRKTGTCNVITMNWLLHANIPSTIMSNSSNHHHHTHPCIHRVLQPIHTTTTSNENTKKSKSKRGATGGGGASGSNLLSCLQAMVTRETCQKGAGARMFVQACIMAGCDYAPSRLQGIGIVSAFKMIKENAYRDPGRRFYYILKGFPKDKILPSSSSTTSATTATTAATSSSTRNDIRTRREDASRLLNEYEELLAKSEAVFFFHHVLELSNNQTIQLLPTGEYTETNSSSEIPQDNEQCVEASFRPCIKRFNNDISFIYKSSTKAKVSSHSSSVVEAQHDNNQQQQQNKNINKSNINKSKHFQVSLSQEEEKIREEASDSVLGDIASSLMSSSNEQVPETTDFSKFLFSNLSGSTSTTTASSTRKRNSPTSMKELYSKSHAANTPKRQVTLDSDEELDDVSTINYARRKTYIGMQSSCNNTSSSTSLSQPTKEWNDDDSSDESVIVEKVVPGSRRNNFATGYGGRHGTSIQPATSTTRMQHYNPRNNDSNDTNKLNNSQQPTANYGMKPLSSKHPSISSYFSPVSKRSVTPNQTLNHSNRQRKKATITTFFKPSSM